MFHWNDLNPATLLLLSIVHILQMSMNENLSPGDVCLYLDFHLATNFINYFYPINNYYIINYIMNDINKVIIEYISI